MSPYRKQQKRAAWALIAGVIGIVALIVSVWLVGHQAASSIHSSESHARQVQAASDARARAEQTHSLRAGCARAVARDFESWGTNRDLAGFAGDAARARRLEGRRALARRYERRARSARARMRSIKARLPAHEDVKSIATFCRSLYPDPGR